MDLRPYLFRALTAVGCLAASACASAPRAAPTPAPETEVAAAPAEPAAAAAEEGTGEATDCAGGVVKDDGTVETGYGFVPQATDGVYLQAFHADEFPSREMEKVCICWMKSRYDRDIEFEVVFYKDAAGVPAAEPYASVPATATVVAERVREAGAFYEVDVSGVTLASGPSFIGVRWNPTQAPWLFICTDTSEKTEKVNVFYREDVAPRWIDVFKSKDPIFWQHRSILLRAQARQD